MNMKIAISNRFTGELIFEHECENNTMKKTLEEAVRQQVKIIYADFSGIDLRNANLKGARLIVDLVGANLEGADLSGATLQCDFENANLKNVCLERAYVHGSNFTGSNLSGANLKNATIYFNNFLSCDMSNSIFDPLNFTGNNINNVYFKNTSLTNDLQVNNFIDRQCEGRQMLESLIYDATSHL
jgi:uncharacterized protein YjbI with pentapeptide repeats